MSSQIERIGRVISRHRYAGLSRGAFFLAALFLIVAVLPLYLVVSVQSGQSTSTISDPALFYNSFAGAAAIGVALILMGLWARRSSWLLGENGVAYRNGGRVQVWLFDQIIETSRFYKLNVLLVGLAWRDREGRWIGVNAHLSKFRAFHDALTAATTTARVPRMLERLRSGDTLEFKGWQSGVTSTFMIDFGSTMNVLAPKARVIIRLTRDTLTVGNQSLKLDEIADWEVPDTWKKPVMHFLSDNGSTALTLEYQHVIDFPLFLAIIEKCAAVNSSGN